MPFVCVWLQLQSQSFREQPIKPMRERESFVTSLILLLLLYEIFLTNGTLSLSFRLCVCVCVILAASSIKIQPAKMWKNGRIPPVLHGEEEVIAFLSHIQMSGSSGEHEEFEWPWTVTLAHGWEEGKSEWDVCVGTEIKPLFVSPLRFDWQFKEIVTPMIIKRALSGPCRPLTSNSNVCKYCTCVCVCPPSHAD